MNQISWVLFKTLVNRYGLQMQSFENSVLYEILGTSVDGSILYKTIIKKYEIDCINDFEQNHKNTSNNVVLDG